MVNDENLRVKPNSVVGLLYVRVALLFTPSLFLGRNVIKLILVWTLAGIDQRLSVLMVNLTSVLSVLHSCTDSDLKTIEK